MIIIAGRFETKWDGRCFHLVETRMTKTDKVVRDTTYHPDMEKVFKRVLNILSGDCKDLEELTDLMTMRMEEFKDAVECK